MIATLGNHYTRTPVGYEPPPADSIVTEGTSAKKVTATMRRAAPSSSPSQLPQHDNGFATALLITVVGARKRDHPPEGSAGRGADARRLTPGRDRSLTDPQGEDA